MIGSLEDKRSLMIIMVVMMMMRRTIYKSGKYIMIITIIIRRMISSRSIKAQIEIYGCTHHANFLKTPTNSHLDFHSDSKFRRLVWWILHIYNIILAYLITYTEIGILPGMNSSRREWIGQKCKQSFIITPC